MEYNTLLFIGFLEAIVCFNIMSLSTMYIKKPIKKNIAIGFIIMVIIISAFFALLVVFGVHVVEKYAIIITLTLAVMWYYICSDDKFFISLFQLLTFINIYIAIGYISDILTISYSGIAYQIEYIIIRLLIYLFIIPMLFRYVRPCFRQMVNDLYKEWNVATIMPGIFLLIQTLLLYYPKPYWSINKGDNWTLHVVMLVYCLFFAVYYLFYIQATTIVEKNLIEKRELLIMQQNKLWESEFERRKETEELTNKQKHDMKYHNNVINELLNEGKIEQLKLYMNDFSILFEKNNKNVFCTNPVINSICNYYKKCAENNNIYIKFNIMAPEHIEEINNIDLTCICGNILENAIEGCNRYTGQCKEIRVVVKYINKRLRLQVENTCRSDITFDGDLPMTQKISGGTGIKSIIYTAEKYDGTVSFVANNGKFTANVLLNDIPK